MSLFRRFFFILLTVSLIPLGAAGLWFSVQNRANQSGTLQLHRQVADLASSAVAMHLSGLEERLQFLKEFYPAFRKDVSAEASTRLGLVLHADPDMMGFALTNEQGGEIARWSGVGRTLDFTEAYQAGKSVLESAKSTGRVSSAFFKTAELPAMVLVYPVSKQRYLYCMLNLEGIWNELARYRIGETGEVALVDDSGRLLPFMGRGLPRVDENYLRGLFLKAETGWADSIPADGRSMVGVFEKIPENGIFKGYVLTLQPRSEAFISSSRLSVILLVIALLAAALSAGGAFFLVSFTGGPIEESKRVRNQAEAKLKDVEQRYQAEKAKVDNLLFNIPDGIVLANLRGEVLYINDAAMTILGVKPEEVNQANKKLFELVHHSQLRGMVQQILERHTHSEVIEFSVDGPQGARTRYFHTKVSMFPTVDQEDFGILLMMRDVTVERELAQLKEEFFHSVAHDLRAPVFAVQGYLRLLERSVQPDAKNRGYFGAIYQSCEKLLLFIQDILDTHRLESGQFRLNITSLEPISFLDRMKVLYGPVAQEKGLALEVKMPQDYPGSFEGDERLLERVFHNLISNALKMTSRGGRILISVASAGQDQVEFSVSDTGVGIPKEMRTLIFEKFRQLDVEPGQEKTGYGLGLSICRKIVELHHGKIWVESEIGKGSEFIFRIPRKQASLVGKA